ncbi:type III restriction protein res subunit [Anaeromyxobacter sp. Fw109-5]|nr:type III restriction protein res subunit [Anaeromyxobacter sp. Fw109-5]
MRSRRRFSTLVEVVKRDLDAQDPRPDGYNVGFNAGEAAGQTVMHLHVHVIPRYRGDMDGPRGGVRHVIPWKGNYRKEAIAPLAVGSEADPFLAHLTPLFARATDVAVVAAFVQDSGLDRLHDLISSAIARGSRVRFVTGDYLAITQAEALSRMLDWEGAHAPGFQARIIECERLPGRTRSFHPKSWQFEGPRVAVAFVGSSNVSESALVSGVEWNLRVDRATDPAAYDRTKNEFEALWARARALTLDWVASYAARARKTALPPPPGESDDEALPAPPEPHEVQQDALAALAASRAEQHRRALVVMATGLGKTLFAALDAEAFLLERGAPIRVLFLAHRRELLAQAAETFRRVLRRRIPELRIGWFAEDRSELDADLVLASVQKLSRAEHLDGLASHRFDYVVVDEVHHADAASYRRILARLNPGFLLGLTATPDRADEGDVLGLFDDHLAFRAGLDVGIVTGRLVPFSYFGLKDVVDYANIPWRNRRFDSEALATAVQTDRRMERLWDAWGEHSGTRSLVFCASIAHVEYVQQWLAARGVRVVAVHSQPGSADREEALRKLAAGELDAVCAVDLFNEGVDVPLVDRVVMLRPTESPVVFLQQLGRGLRVAEGKNELIVIDFVGNHRVFLDHVRTLLSFTDAKVGLAAFLETGAAELPTGCSVDVELEAVELLRKLLPTGGSEVQRVYRELFAARGERPTIGELFRMGYAPGTLRTAHSSWFEFVAGEGHLTADEARTLEAARDWFRELETTAMTKCFKMVTLEVLVEAEALRDGMPLADLARRSHEVLARSPELVRDVEGVKEAEDGGSPEWRAYWRKNPIAAWAGTADRAGRWFRVESERFVSRLPIPAGLDDTFAEMTREIVDYRLAQYRRRGEAEAAGDAFECKVLWNKRDPILKLPSRTARPDVPSGELEVRVQDGRPWRFRLMREFCNVARPVGSDRNELPDLMRRWFGPSAGRPGTAFRVRFYRSPDGWWVEPAGQVIELPRRGNVVAFPTLRAAAGAADGAIASAPEAEEVRLPVNATGADLFAVRAAGDSMDGGSNPIHDGDWLVFRLARGVGLGAMEGRIALLQTGIGGDHAYQVKRVVQEDGRWRLRSDNSAAESFDATAETTPVARLVETVRPESLAPPVGEKLGPAELRKWFGIDGEPRTGRVEGHLFVVAEGTGSLAAPDRVAVRVPDRRPGETAFVLGRVDADSWRYLGVGRWNDAETAWAIPDVHFEAWRALGAGRSASRRLPAGALERAASCVEAALAESRKRDGWLERNGRRMRVLGLAPKGGLRIDGGEGGFAERTVSLTDVAWCLVAKDDVAANGGVLDEARVNRVRYLEGTPKGSTRWIDTGWALMLV